MMNILFEELFLKISILLMKILNCFISNYLIFLIATNSASKLTEQEHEISRYFNLSGPLCQFEVV